MERVRTASRMAHLALAVTAVLLVDSVLPRGVNAEEQVPVSGWCEEWEEWDGWWHDFDLLQPSGHECYDGSPNSWHMNVQSNKCSTYHTRSAGCVF